MARIAGVDLPRNKRVVVGLQAIYGIGPHQSRVILGEAGIDESVRTDDLTGDQVTKIASLIEGKLQVEGDLRREVQMSIKRLMDLQTYRGRRHARNLPTRGQRTRTNARTRKGPVRGQVAAKKKATKK